MNARSGPARIRHQRGASLVVVLILLLVMTLLGLAILRGTLLEERMTANLYDRSLAFQSAEGALRDAEVVVRTSVLAGNAIGFDCTAIGQVCPAIPANAHTSNIGGCAANTQDCWIDSTQDAQELPVGPAQYYIEFIGQRDSTDALGQGSSANANQYGGSGGVPLERLFRISARSNNPALSNERAVVVLQTNISVK